MSFNTNRFEGYTPIDFPGLGLGDDHSPAPAPARPQGGRRRTSPDELGESAPEPTAAPLPQAADGGWVVHTPQPRRVKPKSTSLIVLLFQAAREWLKGG
jgi:hypothetical protein